MEINIYKNSEKQEIIVPDSLALSENKINIHFGRKNAKAKVKSYDDQKTGNGYSHGNPVQVKITSGLQNKLLIPDSLKYQFKVNKDNLIIGPVIAYLLSNYSYIPAYIKRYYKDRFELGKYFGGLIFAFSPDSIDYTEECIRGLYYNKKNSEWEKGRLPIPSFIYQRSFSAVPQKVTDKLRNLTTDNLYNSYRFSKLELYKLLSKNHSFKQFLPRTEEIKDFGQVINFTEDEKKVILKPVNSSCGRGIFVIEKTAENIYKFSGYNKKNSLTSTKKELQEILKKHYIYAKKYIIQDFLNLKQIDGAVFDVRVVLQKTTEKNWICTGTEVRKARKGQYLTNIARGGTALTLAETLQKITPSSEKAAEIKENILALAHKSCSIIDSSEENYFEFGIDIALDKNNKLWFLEANVLPDFKGIKSIDSESYHNILINPLKFALTRTGFEFNKE